MTVPLGDKEKNAIGLSRLSVVEDKLMVDASFRLAQGGGGGGGGPPGGGGGGGPPGGGGGPRLV